MTAVLKSTETDRARRFRPTGVATFGGRVLVAGLLAVALFASACASDAASESRRMQGSESVAGIPPQPLVEETTVKVAMDARIEAFASLLLADIFGEFARENIKIEYMIMPSQDAISVLGAGKVDVVATGLQAATFNAISSGVSISAVAPAFYKSGPKDGLWISNQHLGCAPTCLKGMKIGSSTGPGASTITTIQDYLETGGLSVGDVEIVEFPTADVPAALENGAVAGATLRAPAYNSLLERDTATNVASEAAGRPPGMYWFGPELLDKEREVGAAFVRALARANRLYLDGNYKDDPQVVKALAVMEDVPEATVLKTPPFEFSGNLTFDTSLVGELQDIWLKYYPDILKSKQPIPESEVLNLSFADACCR